VQTPKFSAADLAQEKLRRLIAGDNISSQNLCNLIEPMELSVVGLGRVLFV
jgi:hypothetical protein